MENKITQLLSKVRNPASYLGKEINVYIKKWEKEKVKIALSYPDIYSIGMSSLGLRILYGMLNERDDCICERFFAPLLDMEEILRKENIPLFTLETKTPVTDFDIVGFSLSSELNYTNVLNLLDISKIPIFSKERGNNEPIIIAGGNSVFNPFPLIPFIDVFVIGEGEEVMGKIVETYRELRGEKREKILKCLSEIQGVFVPMFPKNNIKKASVFDFENSYFPKKYLVPLTDIIHDRISLEIMRGCYRNCKFCQAGKCWKPVRKRSPEKILEIAKETFEKTGYEEISLLSFSAGDHPEIEKIINLLVEEFKKKNVSISFPSLRLDTFTFQLASKIKEIKKSSLTFAPETSENLRNKIGKEMENTKLFELCQEARESGWRHIKLYFMIGLPDETEKDISEIVNLINDISKIIKVNVSFNTFIPKPHTEFEKEKFISLDEYEQKKNFITESHKKNRYVKVDFHPYNMSCVECFLARGDEKISKVIYNVWKKGGKMENWNEFFDFEKWTESFKETGIDMKKYTNYIESTPWKIISL